MIEFLRESDNFAGIAFSGMFNMNLIDLQGLYNHYKETGENLIDDYCTVYRLSWEDGYHQNVVDTDEYNKRMSAISNMRRIGYFDPDYLRKYRTKTKELYNDYLRRQEINRSEPRKRASKYTSKKSVRKRVFSLHGKKCLCCGSDKKIQLDHVKSVYKGGKNEIDNLQPLCKSCNVRKGTKTIDYRDNG